MSEPPRLLFGGGSPLGRELLNEAAQESAPDDVRSRALAAATVGLGTASLTLASKVAAASTPGSPLTAAAGSAAAMASPVQSGLLSLAVAKVSATVLAAGIGAAGVYASFSPEEPEFIASAPLEHPKRHASPARSGMGAKGGRIETLTQPSSPTLAAPASAPLGQPVMEVGALSLDVVDDKPAAIETPQPMVPSQRRARKAVSRGASAVAEPRREAASKKASRTAQRPPAQVSSTAAELRVLAQVRDLMKLGEAQQVIELTQEYHAQFPRGLFRPEMNMLARKARRVLRAEN